MAALVLGMAGRVAAEVRRVDVISCKRRTVLKPYGQDTMLLRQSRSCACALTRSMLSLAWTSCQLLHLSSCTWMWRTGPYHSFGMSLNTACAASLPALPNTASLRRGRSRAHVPASNCVIVSADWPALASRCRRDGPATGTCTGTRGEDNRMGCMRWTSCGSRAGPQIASLYFHLRLLRQRRIRRRAGAGVLLGVRHAARAAGLHASR